MINCRCPHCRMGKVFVGSPYAIKKRRVNEICPYCGQYFEIEPGYFYAAMYISYFMMMFEGGLSGWLLFEVTKSEAKGLFLAVILLVTLSLSPINFRYSRLILLILPESKNQIRSKIRERIVRIACFKGSFDIPSCSQRKTLYWGILLALFYEIEEDF